MAFRRWNGPALAPTTSFGVACFGDSLTPSLTKIPLTGTWCTSSGQDPSLSEPVILRFVLSMPNVFVVFLTSTPRTSSSLSIPSSSTDLHLAILSRISFLLPPGVLPPSSSPPSNPFPPFASAASLSPSNLPPAIPPTHIPPPVKPIRKSVPPKPPPPIPLPPMSLPPVLPPPPLNLRIPPIPPTPVSPSSPLRRTHWTAALRRCRTRGLTTASGEYPRLSWMTLLLL